MKIYCNSEYCTGESLYNGTQIEEDENLICPICYEPFLERQIVILEPCKHLFCKNCTMQLRSSRILNQCPMCRKISDKLWCLSKPTKLVDFSMIKNDHWFCDIHPKAKEYLEGIRGDWKRITDFIYKTQIDRNSYYGIKGLQILNFEEYMKNGGIIYKGKCDILTKSKDGQIKLSLSCLLPNLSIRLNITQNDDYMDIDVDNDYADKAIGCMADQLDSCWRVFPCLVNNAFKVQLYVRKFDKITASLLLIGHGHISNYGRHATPARKELINLKQCNFDRSHIEKLRKQFLPLSLQDSTFRAINPEECDCVSEDTSNDYDVDLSD